MQLDYGTAGHKGLSYSRLQTLHTCARKYQIENSFGLKKRSDSVTFSYGHAVAAGVQSWFTDQNLRNAVIETAKFYTMPYEDYGTASEMRAKKSLWYAIEAVQLFDKQMKSAIAGDLAVLQDWEIAYFAADRDDPDSELKAAIELQFRILLDDDFVYEGHIDLVLRHKTTGEYAILELKTTSFNDPHESIYGNSSQALSYSIVLDQVVGHSKASYMVMYLIWSSSRQNWIVFKFPKVAKQRLNWINNLQRDCQLLQFYEEGAEQGVPYPENGNSCYAFFRPCEYYQVCDLEDNNIMSMYKSPTGDNKSFEYEDRVDFEFKLDDIINSQVAKIESSTGLEIETNGESNASIIDI